MNKQEYNKKHYKAFKVDLKIDELNELEEMLKKDKLSKASFLRFAINDYKRAREHINFTSITYKDVINKEE